MSVSRNELINFLDRYLLSDFKFKDATFNGLQVEGKETVRRVGFAVDSSLQTFEEAIEEKVDFLITHHGMIWGGLNRIAGINRQRLSLLLQNNINLYVSHLPLDLHPESGNNIWIVKALGAQTKNSFLDIGYLASWESPISYSELLSKITTSIGEPVGEMPFGPNIIESVGVSSGSFSSALLDKAIEAGVSTILTGEGSSLLFHTAFEAGINLIFAGHYATETFGVKALLSKIQDQSDVETVFLDLPTGW